MAKLKKDLTFKLEAGAEFSGANDPEVRYLREYRDDGVNIQVPRYYPLEGFTVVDKRARGEEVWWKFTRELYERPGRDQKAAVAALLHSTGGILMARPGKGKTAMALAAAAHVGRRTCIVVPSELLLKQWIERIKQFTNLEEKDIGVVKGSFCDWKHPIVLGMLQSLSRALYPPEFYNSVGVFIADEVHKLGAEHFLQVISKFPARVRWGLSATPERRDGNHAAFMYHLGPILYEMMDSDLTPSVWRIHTQFAIPREFYVNHWNGEANLGKLHSVLSRLKPRNHLIAEQLLAAYDKGRRTLALSRRLDQLDIVRQMLLDLAPNDKRLERLTGIIKGGKTKRDNENRVHVLATCKNVLASEQIAGYALDEPTLDTLICMTPNQDVQQTVGRIEREHETKKPPLVVDLVDQGAIFQSMAAARLRKYLQQGYEVHNVKAREQ